MNRKDKSGKGPQSVPTNIESATQEHVRDSLAAWDAKIRARRAKRLRISAEQAGDVEAKPLFMVEIEARAATEKRTVDSLLREYRDRLQQSTYPTPACLLVDEVAAYAEGGLPLERLQHANVCQACATLIAGAVPTDEAAAEFVEALRTPFPVETEEALAPAAAAKWPGFDWGFVKRWASVVVIPGAALVAMYFVSLTVDANAARQTFLHSPLPWVSGLTVALLGWWSVSELKRHPVLRSVGIGLAFTAVLASSFVVDFRRGQSADRDFAIKSALDQLTQISVNSLQNRQANGQFMDVQHLSGPLQIETTELSRSQVRYVATSRQVPGQAVADIGDNGGGEIKWEEGDQTIRQLQFLTGKLLNEGGVLEVQLSDGRSYNLKGTNVGNLPPNTPVFAVVDPSTASVQSLQILNPSSQEALTHGPANKRSD
jgi:hypothetical protein